VSRNRIDTIATDAFPTSNSEIIFIYIHFSNGLYTALTKLY
jgi:hypothetical protein